MTVLGSNDLSVVLGTRRAGSDEDLGDALVQLINSAQASVRVASQQLSHRSVVESLIRARTRGLVVRVLLEADYLGERGAIGDPWARSGRNEANREALRALLRGRVAVRFDRSSYLFHSNFAAVDTAKPSAGSMLSSANFTDEGFTVHWNASVLTTDQQVTAALAREFDSQWGRDADQDGDAPIETTVGEVPLKLVVGPRHAPEMEVMKQIAKATRQVRFAMYTFSTSSGIDDVLALSASNGAVQVRGVLDEQIRNQRWVASHGLLAAGVSLHWLGSADRKLHHKLVTIDDNIAIIGTFNFTKSARFSHESLVVLGSADSDSPEQRSLVAGLSSEIDQLCEQGRRA